jgi:hypothetical protein
MLPWELVEHLCNKIWPNRSLSGPIVSRWSLVVMNGVKALGWLPSKVIMRQIVRENPQTITVN